MRDKRLTCYYLLQRNTLQTYFVYEMRLKSCMNIAEVMQCKQTCSSFGIHISVPATQWIPTTFVKAFSNTSRILSFNFCILWVFRFSCYAYLALPSQVLRAPHSYMSFTWTFAGGEGQLEIESSVINSSWTITHITSARISLTMPILIKWFGHGHEEAAKQTDGRGGKWRTEFPNVINRTHVRMKREEASLRIRSIWKLQATQTGQGCKHIADYSDQWSSVSACVLKINGQWARTMFRYINSYIMSHNGSRRNI